MNSAAMTAESATDAPALRVYEAPEERRNRLVADHLNLVTAAARRYSRGKSMDPDLYQAGALALTEAIDADPTAGRKKLALCVYYAVRRESCRTVAGVVEMPHDANGLRMRIDRARESLGVNATPQQVCKALGISDNKRGRVARLMRLMDAGNGWTELHATAGSDGRETEQRYIEINALRVGLRRLTVRQRKALVCRFIHEDGINLEDVATMIGCSPRAAGLTLSRALARLRTIMEAK